MSKSPLKKEYDLIILGGGCSGLQLANQIIWKTNEDSTIVPNLKILIIESREHYVNDKTWCFWDDGTSHYNNWSYSNWQKWSFSSNIKSSEIVHRSNKYKYFYLKSIDFYDKSIKLIMENKNFSIKLGTWVENVENEEGGFLIKTKDATFFSKKIVDCRYQTPKNVRDPIWQIFYGYEIDFENSSYSKDLVGLMNKIRYDDSGIFFHYILPISERTLLLQVTYIGKQFFLPEKLKSEVIFNISKLQKSAWNILRTESGILLQSGEFDKMSISNSVRGGSNWGALRPSTGYAFSRIYQWSSDTADLLLGRKKPKKNKTVQKIQNFMDEVFLIVLKNYPKATVDTLLRLGKQLDPDTFARFMSDRAKLTDLIKVILACPKFIMTSQAINLIVKHRVKK
ncbi:MAG: hypothetical protein CMK56_03105 [Proteobacteria bacterium]|nr:hypothetical protein [Pseudomonadota bacterium]